MKQKMEISFSGVKSFLERLCNSKERLSSAELEEPLLFWAPKPPREKKSKEYDDFIKLNLELDKDELTRIGKSRISPQQIESIKKRLL